MESFYHTEGHIVCQIIPLEKQNKNNTNIV